LLEAEHSPSGRKTPQELADVLVDIAINGLAKPEKKRALGSRAQGALSLAKSCSIGLRSGE
jgi:hypothetical protein